MKLISGFIGAAGVIAVMGWRLPVQGPDGQALYREHCRTCHGAIGKPSQRSLSQYDKLPTIDSAFVQARSVDSIVTVLKNGKGKDMKSFKSKLTHDQMVAVATYARSLGAGPPRH